MDNFSAHNMPIYRIKPLTFEGVFIGYQYDNVLILFLPLNVTSIIQPLDQGIIAAFKAHYRRQHIMFLVQELKNKTPFKDIKFNMLQVLQWCREAEQFIRGETIAKCWVKSSILLVLQENELKGEGERKKKVGAEKFKNELNELATELTSLGLDDMPSTDSLVHGLNCEIVDDSGKVVGDDEEECESMDDICTEEEEEVDDELPLIPLTKAKEYATMLHHFIMDNLDQPQLFDFVDASYKMVQVVNRMVDSSAKVQQDISLFFPVVTGTNNEDEHE